jgi:tRNA pseudouridine38-40 synthase
MGFAHYKVILSYNGTAFAGFQRQLKERTVQGEFEASLRQIGWTGKSILAAGRTDAGVHARGQVVSFMLGWKHPVNDLVKALNHYLPQDMAVQEASEVPPDFHPRYSAKSRRYRYSLICQQERDPLRETFAWRVWPSVQIERMNTAAADLVGSHDFKAFGSATSESGVTIREVFSANWRGTGDTYQFDITANAFLYHMVRRITWVLVKIGQGEAPETLIADSLRSGELKVTGLAPAEGLVLEEVRYL